MNLSSKLFVISTVILVCTGRSLTTSIHRTASSSHSTDQWRLYTRGTAESTIINDPVSVWIDAINTYIIEFNLSSGISTENALNNFRNQLTIFNITYTERYNFNAIINGVSVQTTVDQYEHLNNMDMMKCVWPIRTAVSSPPPPGGCRQ
jgi:hypothetical protein